MIWAKILSIFTYFKSCFSFTNKRKMISEIMKFSFHHRAFYCYLGMSIWIFFLMTVMYKYISVGNDNNAIKKTIRNEHLLKSDIKFKKIYIKSCNPTENIVRGSEGIIDNNSWLLQGVLVLTRHGDRGPLTHLRGGDKLPCDKSPDSPLLKNYVEFVRNASGLGRAPWVQTPGPFHNFPTLPLQGGGTSCALGQLTPSGLLQMLKVGAILNEAYAEKLGLANYEINTEKHETVVSYITRYRRTYQSLVALLYGLGPGALPARASLAREAHSAAFCFHQCACAAHHHLLKQITTRSNNRLKNHPAVKELVSKLSQVIFESQENTDPDVLRDALLAYLCHDTPLPCTEKKRRKARSLLDFENQDLEYLNQIDFNNEFGRKAREIIGKKTPLDFDAQMEREKLMYYKRYVDNSEYDDVVVVKKHLDADFNFPNDGRYEKYEIEEETDRPNEEICIKRDHVMSLFAYLEWSYKQQMKSVYNRKRGALISYGLIHNIVQNMIRMISDNTPKMVLYSGHDKTLQAIILALGLNDIQHYVYYASRMIFEVYRKRYLRDEFRFVKRKAVAQDFYFRVVYNGEDVTDRLVFCRASKISVNVFDGKAYSVFLCPIESIVRFIHDDYFLMFNASNYKDACATYGVEKTIF